ncbi:MAG: ferritin family protein [Planctomycetia bacterium]|nr:ferritin family protein [Planctomycetia bacterium]
MDIRGTLTEKNLVLAYVVKSENSCRCQLYAAQAVTEGDSAAVELFNEMAREDAECARSFLAFCQGGKVTISMTLRVMDVQKTSENLRSAANSARELWAEWYPKFAEEARSEGLDELANHFQAAAFSGRQQELKFMQMLQK